jgi:RND superfamily putative drug exporter
MTMTRSATHQTRLARLGEFTYRRRRLVVLAWVLGLVIALAASSRLAGEWSADYETPGSESAAALDRLDDRFPERRPYSVDVVWQSQDAGSPDVRHRVDGFLAAAQRLEGMGSGVTTDAARVSADETIGMARIPLDARSAAEVPVETGERVIELARSAEGNGLRIELGGFLIGNAEEGEVSSEMVGLMIAAVVLLLTFGSLVAAGMPLATALFGLGISSALGGILAAVIDVPDWAPAVAAMIGIGVGIDYALLIVTRFRSALESGLDPQEATAEAVATAGRSVLVAGTTVVISMMGLFLMGLTYLHGVAVSAIVAVLVVMAASVTLLPALLGFARQRVNRLRIPGVARGRAGEGSRRAIRWSRLIQRRPWTAAVAGVAVLLALAAPVTGLRLAFPDQGNDAPETTTRQAYDLAAQGFGPGSAGPLVLVAELTDREAQDALAKLGTQIAQEEGVEHVEQPVVNRSGDTGVLTIVPASAPQDAATTELLDRLRDEVVPASGLTADIGGATASLTDQSTVTAQRLPLFIGGVVGLSFLLLVAAFRAPIVAVKAGLLNVLSIGAAYGVVALVADGGFIGELVGIDSATPVPPFIPVMMFAILFGLSMDYEVFLLSRIREEYLATGNTSAAVAEGLARTARVITAAAAIMVVVFAAFVLSAEVYTKLIGIGLAAAVLIDATVIRMVLVPAVMQLLGDRNWWLPRWLDRSMPQLELESQPAPAR